MTEYVFAKGNMFSDHDWPTDDRLHDIYEDKIDELLEKYDPSLTWRPDLCEVLGVIGETKTSYEEFISWWNNEYFRQAWEEAVMECEAAREKLGLVVNSYGKDVDFELATNFMDDELREELHGELAPCSNQVFFDAYADMHLKKFGEEWIADSANPCW